MKPCGLVEGEYVLVFVEKMQCLHDEQSSVAVRDRRVGCSCGTKSFYYDTSAVLLSVGSYPGRSL